MINIKILHIITFILVIVGAVNWGLVGLFDFNLVTTVVGTTGLEKIIYDAVGVSAVYLAITHGKDCMTCKSK